MVHVIIGQGPIQIIEQRVAALSNGWQRLAQGVWLMGSNHPPGILRDQFNDLPGARVAVLRLHRNWATGAMPDVANWLQAAHGIF